MQPESLALPCSAAKAAVTMKSWSKEPHSGDWVSKGVSVMAATAHLLESCSIPVTIQGGKWSIVQGLAMSEFAKEKLAETGKELCEERDEAMAVCKGMSFLDSLVFVSYM